MAHQHEAFENVIQLTPEHEDPVIHRHLASLTSFAPRAGFADRVLARVAPTPAWLRRLSDVRATLFDRQTRWVWAAGAAASAVFSTVVYSTIALTNWATVESAWGTLVRGASSISASSTSSLFALVEPLLSVEGALPIVIAGSVLMMFGCAWGLRRTVHDFQAERVPIRAVH